MFSEKCTIYSRETWGSIDEIRHKGITARLETMDKNVDIVIHTSRPPAHSSLIEPWLTSSFHCRDNGVLLRPQKADWMCVSCCARVRVCLSRTRAQSSGAQIGIFPGDHGHTAHCNFKLITDDSEPLESVQRGVHSPRLLRQGTEPCPKAPGWGPMLNGPREHTRRSWSFFFSDRWLLCWWIGWWSGWVVNITIWRKQLVEFPSFGIQKKNPANCWMKRRVNDYYFIHSVLF